MKESEIEQCLVKFETQIPLDIGNVEGSFIVFEGLPENKEHFAIGLGDWKKKTTPLVRIHSECLTGDVFGSLRCDCGEQLREAILKISRVGGLLIYLRQEGRGIGLFKKLESYNLQSRGLDTYSANNKLGFSDDMREYTSAAAMLKVLGFTQIDLLTNNPDKAEKLKVLGINILNVVNTSVHANKHNLSYLKAKVRKTHHTINLEAAIEKI